MAPAKKHTLNTAQTQDSLNKMTLRGKISDTSKDPFTRMVYEFCLLRSKHSDHMGWV